METENPRFRHGLEVLTNIITVCVLAFFVVVILQKQHSGRNQPIKGAEPEVGSQYGPIAGLDFTQSDKTLVLAISSECKFCRASAPLYRQLRERSEHNKAVKLVMIHPSSDSTFGEFSRQNGLGEVSVFPADFEDLKLIRTPALVLVNRGGRIQKVWIGKLSEKQEAEVLHVFG